MRRRCDAKVMDTGHGRGPVVGWGYPGESQVLISEVPAAWRQHADQPWRVLFPNLEWAPPALD